MTTTPLSDAGMDRLRDAIRDHAGGDAPRPIYRTPEGAILALADSVRRAGDPGTGAVQVMSLVLAAAQFAPAWTAEAWRDLVRHQSELLDQPPARVEADYRARVTALLRAFPASEPAPLTRTYLTDRRHGAQRHWTHIAAGGLRPRTLCGHDADYSAPNDAPPAGYQVCRICLRTERSISTEPKP